MTAMREEAFELLEKMPEDKEELKKENNAKALNLEIEDQRYLDKVTAYAVNQGVGMMETEIIRKDLIGIAEEAKYYIFMANV